VFSASMPNARKRGAYPTAQLQQQRRQSSLERRALRLQYSRERATALLLLSLDRTLPVRRSVRLPVADGQDLLIRRRGLSQTRHGLTSLTRRSANSLAATMTVDNTETTTNCGGPVWAPGRNAPLILVLISAPYSIYIYIYTPCLFISYISPLIPFSSLFPYLSSPPLLIFSFENRPALFPGRMS